MVLRWLVQSVCPHSANFTRHTLMSLHPHTHGQKTQRQGQQARDRLLALYEDTPWHPSALTWHGVHTTNVVANNLQETPVVKSLNLFCSVLF